MREVAEHDARCARRDRVRPLDGRRPLGRLPLAQPPLGAHLQPCASTGCTACTPQGMLIRTVRDTTGCRVGRAPRPRSPPPARVAACSAPSPRARPCRPVEGGARRLVFCGSRQNGGGGGLVRFAAGLRAGTQGGGGGPCPCPRRGKGSGGGPHAPQEVRLSRSAIYCGAGRPALCRWDCRSTECSSPHTARAYASRRTPSSRTRAGTRRTRPLRVCWRQAAY